VQGYRRSHCARHVSPDEADPACFDVL